MKRDCSDCVHVGHGTIRGRDRVACFRSRTLPDGKTLRPPRDGWEASIERLAQSDLDWRAKGDKCGPEAKNWRQG